MSIVPNIHLFNVYYIQSKNTLSSPQHTDYQIPLRKGAPEKNDTGIPTLHSMVTISTQLEHAVQLETILRASQTLYGVYSHYYGTETQ